MKKFGEEELLEAIIHAGGGGQALHLHSIVFENSPKCFKDAVGRGEQIAHLFDQNLSRLQQTARQLGVRVVYIHHKGTTRQHVDLCGAPLRKALEECEIHVS